MTNLIEHADHKPQAPAKRRRTGLTLIGGALLAFGGVAGAVVVAQTRPAEMMAPTSPVAIRSLTAGNIVTIRGQVAETYGNAFIVADASGRALVDTGPQGDGSQLVHAGEPVLVQGRYEDGHVRAAFLVGPDKTIHALGPLMGPRGPHGLDRGRAGPPPAGGRDVAPPPPPAPAAPTGA